MKEVTAGAASRRPHATLRPAGKGGGGHSQLTGRGGGSVGGKPLVHENIFFFSLVTEKSKLHLVVGFTLLHIAKTELAMV